MNRRILLVAIISAMTLPISAMPTPGATSSPVTSPLEIVRKIYAISAGKDGKYQGPSAFESKSIRKLYFSKSLLAAIEHANALSKKRDEPILDFDPVLNTQEEPEVKELSIQIERETPATSVIAATFASYGEKNVVRYEFVKQASSWKLDNMRGEAGEDKWSLRDILK